MRTVTPIVRLKGDRGTTEDKIIIIAITSTKIRIIENIFKILSDKLIIIPSILQQLIHPYLRFSYSSRNILFIHF